MRCDLHEDREAINCSLWARRRYLCEACIAEIQARPVYSGKEDWWIENEPFWGWNEEYRIRHEPEHTIDRSKDK